MKGCQVLKTYLRGFLSWPQQASARAISASVTIFPPNGSKDFGENVFVILPQLETFLGTFYSLVLIIKTTSTYLIRIMWVCISFIMDTFKLILTNVTFMIG